VKVAILGQGFVGSVFAVGIERIKRDELGYAGIPLKDELPIKVEEIEIVGSYDVDNAKVGLTLQDVVKKYWNGKTFDTLRSIHVRRGIHLGSLRNLPIEAHGREDEKTLKDAIAELVHEWKKLDVDVLANVCTTESFKTFSSEEEFLEAIEKSHKEKITATQAYFYAACLYAKERGGAAFVNTIPTLLANDPVMLKLAEKHELVVFGDDGATGATPLTADLLAHQAQRNRLVKDVAQFNIGGNMDFLALTDRDRNRSKEETKSSIVKDILGYDAPHYIKPTGYIESLGDKKFVSLHMEYVSFNGAVDELIVNARINDSPALAGLIVDLVRLGKMAIERGISGTVYEVNAFYMKNPGPKDKPNIPRIIAYEKVRSWAGLKPRWL